VIVASREFRDAAEAQARALGADRARVFVAHPIQDRTDDELRVLADHAFESILLSATADQTAPRRVIAAASAGPSV